MQGLSIEAETTPAWILPSAGIEYKQALQVAQNVKNELQFALY